MIYPGFAGDGSVG